MINIDNILCPGVLLTFIILCAIILQYLLCCFLFQKTQGEVVIISVVIKFQLFAKTCKEIKNMSNIETHMALFVNVFYLPIMSWSMK